MPMTRGPGGFYTAVVCRNGHALTSIAELSPERATPFCPDCASSTLSACEACGKPIPGEVSGSGGYFGGYVPPVYCRYCGAAMPWTAARLEALHEITGIFEGLNDEERATLNRSWDELTRDTPKTQIAVVQVKRLLPKLVGASADAAKKLITDIATEAVRKQMGL
jgi:hypothetical protein